MTVETDDDIITDDNCSPPVGPSTDNPTENIVYNDSTEMSSFYLEIGFLKMSQCNGLLLKMNH